MHQVTNILLIDDDEDDRDIFIEALAGTKKAGIRTFTAENGADALLRLSTREIIPNLIFLDLNMPIMNGLEFLKRIKLNDALKDIPVIILSTSSDPRTIRETKALGARDFITKPDEFSLWTNVINRFLNFI